MGFLAIRTPLRSGGASFSSFFSSSFFFVLFCGSSSTSFLGLFNGVGVREVSANIDTLITLMRRMEEMALDVAREVENTYNTSRCTLVGNCQPSYDGCQSSLSVGSRECRSDYVATCANLDPGCNGKMYDFTESSTRSPEGLLNPTDGQPKSDKVLFREDLCYSNALTPDFKQKAEEFASKNDRIVQPPQTFFGTANGAFRIWPAQTDTCKDNNRHDFDTRIRPWFIAASSGPKDVILVVDTSGSMNNHNRWKLAKRATETVINTLTIGDFFNVVLFSSSGRTLLNGDQLMMATQVNKKRAIQELSNVIPTGYTNFESAFEVAFDVFDKSSSEMSSNCQSAILFLSDGEATTGLGGSNQAQKPQLYDKIRLLNGNHNAMIFSYALGSAADREASKEIACSSGGIYTNIPDNGGDDLLEHMSAYYKLFAIQQGISGKNFTTWVEPYKYASGVMGTTVSSPVFDRSHNPPLWIGVVGIDFTVAELEVAVGGTNAYETVLQRLIYL